MKNVVGFSLVGALVGALAVLLIMQLGDPGSYPREYSSSGLKQVVLWIGTLMGLCSGAIIGAICGLVSVWQAAQNPEKGSVAP